MAHGPALSTTTARNAPPASGADAIHTAAAPSPLKPANNAARSVAAEPSGTIRYAVPANHPPVQRRVARIRPGPPSPSGTAAAEYSQSK